MTDLELLGLLRKNYLRFRGDMPVQAATDRLASETRVGSVHSIAAVLDDDGRFLSFFNLRLALESIVIPDPERGATLAAFTAGQQYPIIRPDDSIMTIIEKVVDAHLDAAPVLDDETDELLGIVLLPDVYDRVCDRILTETPELFAISQQR